MKKIKPASARTLTWLAAALAVVGSMVLSPSAGLLCLSIAALTALFPATFGQGRIRILAAVLLLVTVVIAVSKYTEFRHEQALYRRHTDFQLRQRPASK